MKAIGRLGLSVVMAASMWAGTLFRAPNTAAFRSGDVPAGLPRHFGIGVSAAPSSSGIYGWMPNSGIPWDYAYQYLSAGVNTGTGWETWNSNGQFPLYYANGAAQHGYIPVFSYYDLLQSSGTCSSCGEAQKDLSNLNNGGVMASYFQNFRLLMQRLGPGAYGGIPGFGKTAIVHVEPDLSGYAEHAVLNSAGLCYGYCTAQGNDPSYLRAAVASSGDPDAQGYPNTYQGFNWVLLHIRDLYAPNVQLAFHVSDWATGIDIGSDTGATLDAAALGQEAGAFAAKSGTSEVPSGSGTYDLLFNDVSDRDAGYYKNVLNTNVWWDRANATFPNFHRWEGYVSAASQAAGRPVIVWQIPEGNQYFDTENNTNGHYQDNRAEYFFGHIGELHQAGIIGLLFGAGNGASTQHTDAMNDGITNPTGFCTNDGLSTGQICNTQTSTVADDDGGYIRMQAQHYYAAGAYPLVAPAVTLSATSMSLGSQSVGSKSAGQTVTVSNSGTAPLVFNGIGIGGSNPGDFAETNTCPVGSGSLAVGAACSITVTFTPVGIGLRLASVQISDNAVGSPHNVSVVGTGIPLPGSGTTVTVEGGMGWTMVGGDPLTLWSDSQVNWSFNASTSAWYTPTGAEEIGTGAWEYVGTAGPRTVTVQGCSSSVTVPVTAHRWNLVGNPCSRSVSLPGTARAYWWDPAGSHYVLVTSINPGAAAWVKPDSDALTLS